MSDYKLIKDASTNEICIVLRKTDKTYIPFDPANSDYTNYLEWVAEGNTAEAAD